jgi:hypothetical protein
LTAAPIDGTIESVGASCHHFSTALFIMSVSMNPQMSPDRNWEDHHLEGEDPSRFESILIVDDHHGIYVPQVFCERYEKTEDVPQEDWDICLSGPDHEYYWDSWEIILDNWGFQESDDAGNKWRIALYQEGCLFQARQIICWTNE